MPQFHRWALHAKGRPPGPCSLQTCALRANSFDHPVTVYPGLPEILTHRAQVRRGLRLPPCRLRTTTTKAPATRQGLQRASSARRRAGWPATRSYALRASFFDHPVTVCPCPSEILTHRAQVRRDLRQPPIDGTAARGVIVGKVRANAATKRNQQAPGNTHVWSLLVEAFVVHLAGHACQAVAILARGTGGCVCRP